MVTLHKKNYTNQRVLDLLIDIICKADKTNIGLVEEFLELELQEAGKKRSF